MNNKLELFFQYSTDSFSQIWNVYQHVLKEDFTALSNTDMDDENFIYFGQPILSQKNKKIKKELIDLLKSGKIFIKTPPLIHPAFIKKISEILKILEIEILEVAAYQAAIIDGQIVKRNKYDEIINTGPYFIKTLLESKRDTIRINNKVVNVSEFLITRIPVLPINERWFLEDFLGNSFPGVDNIYYQLIWTISRQLLENEEYQDSSFANSHNFLQQYFEELIVTIQYNFQNNRWNTLNKVREFRKIKGIGENIGKIRKVEKPSRKSLYVPSYKEYCLTESNTIPIDCLYTDESRLCIQFPDRIIFYDFINHKEEKITSTPCYKLKEIDIQKEYIQLYGCQDEEKHLITDFIHYDFKSKQWYTGHFDNFKYYELSHQLERQKLIDYKNGVEFFIKELATYPIKKIQSVCNQYMWINDKYGLGGLYNLETGIALVVKESPDVFLDLEIPLYEIKEFFDVIEDDIVLKKNLYRLQKMKQFDLGTLAIIHKRWIMLHDNILYVNDKAIIKIDFPYTSATFNRTASKLILVNSLAIVIIEINDYINKRKKNYSFIKPVWS